LAHVETHLHDQHSGFALRQRVRDTSEVCSTPIKTRAGVLIRADRSFASSVYTSGANDVSREFGVSHTESLLGLSLFLWALGLGAIIAAPVSEYYGRRIVYLTTVPVFGFFILGSGLAQNFATLIVCRTLAGFFGSAVVSVGGGTNADIWEPARAGFVYPFYFVSPFLGPAFGTMDAVIPLALNLSVPR
jgi:MFS family permease